PGPDLLRTDERVTWIVAFEVRAHREPGRVGRRHVLRGMHGDVDSARKQRLLNLLDEDAPVADLPERTGAVAIAGSGDGDERDLVAVAAKHRGRELGLRQSQPRTARPEGN